jgi:hypothetical protein
MRILFPSITQKNLNPTNGLILERSNLKIKDLKRENILISYYYYWYFENLKEYWLQFKYLKFFQFFKNL